MAFVGFLCQNGEYCVILVKPSSDHVILNITVDLIN